MVALQIINKHMEYQDIELTCQEKNCGKTFLFTAGEQDFMNGLMEDGKIQSVTAPKRCEDCRAKKRERFEKINQRKNY